METEAPRPQPKRGPAAWKEKLKNATTGLIYYCFIVAYTMQTTVVVNYIEEDLKHHYHVNVCETEAEPLKHDNKTVSEHHGDNVEPERDPYQECEEKFTYWNMYMFFVYAIPAFILAPLIGNWSDSINRVFPLYVVEIGLVLSTFATAVAMQLKLSSDAVTFCMFPTCLTGGVILVTIIILSYEISHREGFEIFERFLELSTISVTASTTNQCILTIFAQFVPEGLSNPGAYWIPLVFAVMAFIKLITKRNKIVDKRGIDVTFSKICRQILPIDFYHLFKCPLFMHVLLLFLCTFMYYFDYVSETLEVINIVTKHESWQVISFSVQGALQGAAESLGMLFLLYRLKGLVDKKLVDKKILPKVPLSYLGILALFCDFLAKAIICFVPADVSQAKLWVPLIGVICELAIAVIRFFAVLIVPKTDAGKSLSLLAWAQLLAIVPGPLMVEGVSGWSQSFWRNFVYLFMAVVLIVPATLLWIVGKFGPLPELAQQRVHPAEVHEKPKGGGPPFGKRFEKNHNNRDGELVAVSC